MPAGWKSASASFAGKLADSRGLYGVDPAINLMHSLLKSNPVSLRNRKAGEHL
jgi:hypothetical protein